MMNTRNAPLSPVSVVGSEWSVGKYSTATTAFEDPNRDNNNNFRSGPNTANNFIQPGRGQFISPPPSGGPRNMMNGFPPGPRSLGGPSPPPSIGRQSNGTTLYARSESGRSPGDPRDEGNWDITLGEHYVTFKSFLANAGRGKPPTPQNKARDKLLRLTLGQFLELSTDVYDELRRRQDLAAGRPAPDKLQEEDQFHEKRNEARGKLKYLSPPRFRDLATDVFLELERRFPRFASGDIPRNSNSSPTSTRRPSRSQNQTPVNGGGITGKGFPPPRSGSRMRRPSDASSIRSAAPPVQGIGMSSMNGGGGLNGTGFSISPASPPRNNDGPPPANYDRPLAKQLGANTLVPNKSTMVEEDDDGLPGEDEGEPFGLERATSDRNRDRGRDLDSRRSETTDRSAVASETDKKLLDEYQSQVRELREKLDTMEDAMKRKDDELNDVLEDERKRMTALNVQKTEWESLRRGLDDKLVEAEDLNDSLKEELGRMRSQHEDQLDDLRKQLDGAQTAQRSAQPQGFAGGNMDLYTENQELRMELQEQQRMTDEVRREFQDSLREMKLLSEKSGASWDRQADLERTIEQLEAEVRDWRNRYARTKTQLRNMRASSMGLTIEQDVSKYVKDKGFTGDNGLVKDVHVTKFQIAIDEFLRGARVESPEKVTETMKGVVVSVRRITKDIDESGSKTDEMAQQRSKLKGRVSSSANNLITASKNFATSAGISPVSILDAAASHLVTAVVDLLKTVKIRATPAGELGDDDDGTITPVDSTGFFSPRSTVQTDTAPTTNSSMPVPPRPFADLRGGLRASMDSSAYSPINSPRESVDPYPVRGLRVNGGGGSGGGGAGYMGLQKNLPTPPGPPPSEELGRYLDTLKENIQNLVQSIRDRNAPIGKISDEIDGISDIVERVITSMEASGNGGGILRNLEESRQRLVEAGELGQDLAAQGRDANDREWGMWKQTLPPIAFEIAREMKELIQNTDGADDFS